MRAGPGAAGRPSPCFGRPRAAAPEEGGPSGPGAALGVRGGGGRGASVGAEEESRRLFVLCYPPPKLHRDPLLGRGFLL